MEGSLKTRIGKIVYQLDIANTPVKQRQGLSDRRSMEQDKGMLFVFEQPTQMSFWMKNMYFPLDFIWLMDEQVVDIAENVAAPLSHGGTSKFINIVNSRKPFNRVIELNAGEIVRNGIKIGDRIELPLALPYRTQPVVKAEKKGKGWLERFFAPIIELKNKLW